MRAVFGSVIARAILAGLLLTGTYAVWLPPATAQEGTTAEAATPAAPVTSDAEWDDCSSDDSDLSIEVCTRIIDRGDQETTANRAQAHMKRGVSHYRKAQFDAAIDDWSAALVFQPNSTLVLRVRADTLVEQGRYEQAIGDYSKIIAQDPKDITTILLRSTTRALALDYDGATADAYQAISLDPKRSEPHYVLAHVSFLHNDFDRAQTALDQAITLNDGRGEYYVLRGQTRLYRSDLDGAKEDFEKGTKIDPKLQLAYSGLSQVERFRGETDAAVATLGRGIEISPDSPSMYADRANILIEAGRDADAAADLEKAISINTQILARAVLSKSARGDALTNRAFARTLQGDYEQAIADANEALNLQPHSGDVLDSRGLAYALKGDYARAISDLSQGIGYGGDVLSIYLHRAQANLAFGNYGLAIEDYKKVLSWAPAYPAAREGLASAEKAAKDDDEAGTPTASTPRSTPDQPATEPVVAETAALGKRVALIIGNGTYTKYGQLPNPKRDAEKMAETLREVGFTKVTIAEDLTGAGFNEALHQFSGDADGADWAVIYYAGHGIEIDNTNYLVPVDATLASDRDVPFETVPLERMVTALEGAKGMRLVILDACRENPFATSMTKTSPTRSIGRGLAQVEPETGTLVAYSAKAGQVALDGDGENSPYVIALTNRIRSPGLEISKLFRLVRDDVLAQTGKAQEPFTYGSLSGTDMFINPAPQ